MKAILKISFTACLLLLTTLSYADPSTVIAKLQALLQNNMPNGNVTIREVGSVVIIAHTNIGKNFDVQIPYAHVTYKRSYSISGKDTTWYAGINSIGYKDPITIIHDNREHTTTGVSQSFHSLAAVEEFISLMEALKEDK